LQLHFERPSASEAKEVLALMSALPASLLADAVAAATGRPLWRLPEETLGGTRKLLHRAVSEGGALGRRAYPLLSELEQKLSTARR
jgi:hypothetical protein